MYALFAEICYGEVMKKNLKNFWEGKVSFGQSFWLWYFIGGSALSIPFFVITDESIDASTGIALFTILYFIFFACALIFLIIGAWKSAENYKKIKKKKKQGSGWAIAGQIYIVLATLRGVVEMIKSF